LTVRNIQAGARLYDIWAVNEDAEYHESGHDAEHDAAALTAGERAALASGRAVPGRTPRRAA